MLASTAVTTASVPGSDMIGVSTCVQMILSTYAWLQPWLGLSAPTSTNCFSVVWPTDGAVVSPYQKIQVGARSSWAVVVGVFSAVRSSSDRSSRLTTIALAQFELTACEAIRAASRIVWIFSRSTARYG